MDDQEGIVMLHIAKLKYRCASFLSHPLPAVHGHKRCALCYPNQTKAE